MDATLKRLWIDMHPDEIAVEMGVTVASVKARPPPQARNNSEAEEE